jgi:hypothetical protein
VCVTPIEITDQAIAIASRQHLKTDPVKRAEREAKGDVVSLDRQAAFSSFLFTHNPQHAQDPLRLSPGLDHKPMGGTVARCALVVAEAHPR